VPSDLIHDLYTRKLLDCFLYWKKKKKKIENEVVYHVALLCRMHLWHYKYGNNQLSLIL
jgi:hypothetical protein